MQRPKTVAATVGLVAVTTATAFALNVGVLEATGPASADEPTSAEPEVVTVVVDAPVDPATTMPASTTAPAAPAATAAPQATAPTATSPAWSAAAPTAPAPAPSAPPPTVASTTSAGPPPTVAPTTTTITGPPPTVAPTAPPSSVAPATEYLTFATAGGDVVIANHGTTLEFWAADPPAGWAYRVEDPSGREIEIEYRRGEQEAKVKVKLEGGRVHVESEGFAGGGDDD